jgi:hypothetical protein
VFYRYDMAQDDWRLRIELDEEAAGGLLARLGVLDSEARALARELADERLAVTREGRTLFVYANSSRQLEQAGKVIDTELARLGIEPDANVQEHWLADEDRWDDEPVPDTMEAETLAAGYAPWEVRIPCRSHHEARELATRLEAEGYTVLRRWAYVIVATATREEAQELADRLHGEVEPGGELVWEVSPGNPFAIFGGLGGAGTPL